jgi:hypothetical protein
MKTLLRIYSMSEAENAADAARDRELLDAGQMTEREFFACCATRNFARRLRRDDDDRAARIEGVIH